jgi:response regulator RpfG family c-di-GMP phosphodiesterase
MLEGLINISDEEEASLFSIVQKISSYENRLDPGLALLLYQKLLQWAKERLDDDKIIKYLYWCGITSYFLEKEQWEKIFGYFNECASYLDRYHEFEDPETRRYIHRCFGNLPMALYAMGKTDDAIEAEGKIFSFWNKLIFTGKDLEFPWLNFFLSVYNTKYAHEVKQVRAEPEQESKENIARILDTAMTINKLYHKNRESHSVFGGSRYDFYLWEAQFFSGLISFDQLSENIQKRQALFSEDDYSADAVYANTQLPSFLMFYASKMRKLADKKDEVLARESKKLMQYISLIPINYNPNEISERIQLIASNLSDILTPMEHLDFVMKMTTFRHIPTYAHSIMVGKIAVCLTKYLVLKKPSCLVGYMDFKHVEDVINNADMLYNYAQTSGLCHDIGKITYIYNPFMLSRELTESEMEIVRKHANAGNLMLARSNSDSLYTDYSEVILGHHKYYDNSDGYPDDYSINRSSQTMMVDIITVADSIDAATDDIGKVYAEAKNLTTVISEIKADSGRRYSPAIADLLECEDVLASLEFIINEERIDAYYTAYLHAGS